MSDIGWIRLNTEVPHHAKFVLLANELGVREAWPRVVQLWCWAANSAKNGDLSGLKDRQIADFSGWKGNATRFVSALRSVGLLDPDNRIHDWDDEQGKMLERLEKDRDRKRQARASKAVAAPAVSAGLSAPAVADASRARGRTVRDGTGRDGKKEQDQVPAPAVAGGPPSPTGPKAPKPSRVARPKWRDPCPALTGAGIVTAHDPVPAGEEHPDRENCTRCAAFHDLVVDAVDATMVRVFGAPPDHGWTPAAFTQLAAARRAGMDGPTICRALEGLARDTFNRTQALHQLLEPGKLATGLRAPVPVPLFTPEKPRAPGEDRKAPDFRPAHLRGGGP